MLRLFLIFICLFNFAFSITKGQLESLSSMLANPLFELNELELKNISKDFIEKNENINYLVIYDTLVNKKLLSYYKDKNNHLIEKKFDEKTFTKQCEKVTTKVIYNKEQIGSLIICFKDKAKILNLSKKEKEWLKNNPLIKVHNEYDWAPFNYNKNGVPKGYSVDYIKLLAKLVGFKVKFVTGTWNESLQRVYDKKIDVIMNIAKTKEREKHLLYVDIFAKNVTSILTTSNREDISDIKSLFGKKVSVVKGFVYESLLAEKYPEIKVITYKNTLDSIKAIVYGEVDATLGKTAILSYLMDENVIKGLKYTSDVKADDPEMENLYIAVRNDAPILQSILKKAMKKVSIEDLDKIKLKWFSERRKIRFTKEEYNWLDKRIVVKYSEINWRPLSIIENNTMTGIMGDYLNIVSESTGIKFKFVPSHSWSEVLEKFKRGEIDLVPGIGNTKEETSLGLVSKEYASFPMVIVTNEKMDYVSLMEDIKDKVFSIPKHYTSYNYIKQFYPNVKIIETDNIFEALLNVSNGKADVFIGHMAPAIYYMTRIGKDNLKIAGDTGNDFKHHFLINKNLDKLYSIVNKVIDTITEKEREKIYNDWVQIKVEQNTGFSIKKILSYVLPIFFVVLIIIFIIVYWNKKLRSLVNKKTFDINKQKEQLQKLVDSFDRNVIFVQTDLKGITTHPSESFCNISGYTKKELVGKPISIVKSSDTSKSTFTQLWDSLNKNKKWEGEIKNRSKDGKYYWLYSKIEAEYNTHNEIIGYKSISQDITNRKIVEDLSKNLELKVQERTFELLEQKSFVQTLLDSQEQIVITTDGKNIRSANKKFLEFFNIKDLQEYKKEYKCISDRFKNDDTNTYLQKYIKDKKWIDYIIENKSNYHKVMINKDGEDKIFSVTAASLSIGDGDIKSAVFTDITELEFIRKNIETILSNIMLPVLITSQKDRTILYANEYASIQYEIPVSELIGKSIETVYTTLNQKDEILLQMKKQGYVENLEQRFRTNSGKEFIALLSVKPISYNDEDAFIGMVVDITRQKDIEEELRLVHKHTKDSIEYASLIQYALIPSNEILKEYFSDYLTIWEPKDIVGGDIYLFEELREGECLLMVIDCTGHGVPGAFVTMLVKAIERQINANIKNKEEVVSPSKVLSIFNRSMKHLLKQDDETSMSNAGFDGAVLYYNKKDSIIKFAGAQVPLFYEHNGEFKTIKGSRHSIGYKKSNRDYEFKEHTLKVQEGMQFYITTDGYLDQNGGKKGFPFGKRRFLELMKKNYQLPFADQQEILLYEMMDYQGSYERNDDITIVGFKI
ncbi:MAG: transporter substrate-binding domain-containing protein [Halarcobacter sp.]